MILITDTLLLRNMYLKTVKITNFLNQFSLQNNPTLLTPSYPPADKPQYNSTTTLH
jgi:hypothetical protein